jgi:PAS domain S-box-containing protein
MNMTARILVVDDEPVTREFFSTILHDAGYEVWEAATGQECLQVTRARRPDLVLLDVQLPDLDGFDVCSQIKADAALVDTFVILVSGKATSAAAKATAAETGADDYLVKPVDQEEFLPRIRTIVRLRNAAAALRASEQHYRQLVEILPDAVGMIDLQGGLTTVNRRAVEMLGYAGPEELLGRSVFDLTPPAEHEHVKANITATLDTGIMRNVECALLRKDGGRVSVELSAAVSIDLTSQSRGIVIVMRDITARQQAEARIRELLHILDQAHDAIIIRDLDDRVQYLNKGAERLLGWAADEARGRCIAELHFPNASAFAAAREKLHQTGEWSGEVQAVTKDRKPIVLQSQWTLVRGHDGRSQHILGISTDYTERKWTRRLLQTQRDFGTFLSSSISLNATALHLLEVVLRNEGIDCGGVFLVDRQAGALVLVAHRGFSAGFDKRASHFAADPALAAAAGAAPPASRQADEPLTVLAKLLKLERLLATEILPIQHGGQVVAVLCVGSHVNGEIPAKSCQAMEAVATQAGGAITRIKAEQSLRASRRLLERILESLPLAVFVVNAGTLVIEECNAATAQVFGYTRDELIGRTATFLHVDERRAEEFEAYLRAAVEERGFLSNFEFQMRRKDGTLFPTEQSVMSIRNEVGRLVSRVNVVQDITERKRAEDDLRQLPRRIIEAQETERLRVAREMHDGVNQVIASVKMRLRKVEGHVATLSPAAREILARCDKLLVRALEENRRIAHNLRPSDLDELGLVAACRNFCKEFQTRTNLVVRCNLAPMGGHLVPATELNLFRILQESLTNVEKHARARTVRLRLSFQGDFVTLRIQDDGCGFPSQRSRTGRRRWRGIGLTNMRERALSLGGTFEVQSTPKKGTIVNVCIPCQRAG